MSYFQPKELYCRCPCHIYNPSVDLIDKINWVREAYKKSLIITSGCRCPSHNERVGGSKTSSHLTTKKKKCKALDIEFPKNGKDMFSLLEILLIQFKRIGINFKKKFFHVDTDRKKKSPCLWFYN